MTLETLLMVLLAWAVAGTLAGLVFGKAMQRIGNTSYTDEPNPTTPDNVKDIRKFKRKPSAKRFTVAHRQHDSVKRAAG